MTTLETSSREIPGAAASPAPLGGDGAAEVSAQEGQATHHHPNGTVQQVDGSSGADTALSTNGSVRQASYPKSRVSLVDRFMDEPRKLRVAVIGGGLSGILSGILLPEKVPGIELVIYEKNPEFVSGLTSQTVPPARSSIY